MTEPENPWAPDANPPLHHEVVPPPGYDWDPYAGGYGYGAPPPKRPWYRAPGTLAGAATFTALNAWVTVGMIALLVSTLNSVDDEEGFLEAIAALVVVLVLIAFIGTIGLATFCFAVAGAAATIPLVVVWFREPNRSTAAGLHALHAAVAFVAMIVTIVLVL